MKIHTENCNCRNCKKKEKKNKQELEFVRRSFLLVFLFFIICF